MGKEMNSEEISDCGGNRKPDVFPRILRHRLQFRPFRLSFPPGEEDEEPTRPPLPRSPHDILPRLPQLPAPVTSPRRKWFLPTSRVFDGRAELGSAYHRRKAELQRDAESDQAAWRAQQQLIKEQRRLEKLENMKMLKEYYPWGRPGAGAPTNITKKQKFVTSDSTKSRETDEKGFLKFGTPGHGAPCRSPSGRVQAQVAGDPSIRFSHTQNVGKAIENGLRYRKSPNTTQAYKTDLDGLLEVKKIFQQKEQEIERHKEGVEVGAQLDPFGQSPHPALPRHQSELLADPVFFTTSPAPSYAYKRSPVQVKLNGLPSNNLWTTPSEAPLPLATLTKDLRRNGMNHAAGSVFPPSEASVPGQETYPQARPNGIHDLHPRTTEAKRAYLEFLRMQIEKNKSDKLEQEKWMKEPAMDLVPLMEEKPVGRPKRDEATGELLDHKLATTDVTCSNKIVDLRPAPPPKIVPYHQTLEQQRLELKRLKIHQREQEKQEAQKHFEVWAALWGKPGHGAPRDSSNHKKENLWRLLLEPLQNQGEENKGQIF